MKYEIGKSLFWNREIPKNSDRPLAAVNEVVVSLVEGLV